MANECANKIGTHEGPLFYDRLSGLIVCQLHAVMLGEMAQVLRRGYDWEEIRPNAFTVTVFGSGVGSPENKRSYYQVDSITKNRGELRLNICGLPAVSIPEGGWTRFTVTAPQ